MKKYDNLHKQRSVLKRFYSRVFFLFVFIFCILSLTSCITNNVNGNSLFHSRLNAEYKTIDISENISYLKTKIKYPEFTKYSKLNRYISNTVNSNYKNFKSYSKNEWGQINTINSHNDLETKLPPFEYNTTFEVSKSDQVISVLLNTYIFTGGAHGNTTLISLNYNVKENKFINIVQASGLTIDEISSISRKYLTKKLIDDNKALKNIADKDFMQEMINTGAFPQAGNFEIFCVDGKKVYVYFEPYSVAPYAYGIQKVQIK